MKKIIILCFIGLLASISAFSQTAVTLDTGLNNSTAYLTGRIPAKTKVVVLNFTSKWPELSDYIIEELIGYIVNEGTLTVVDRSNLEAIRKEMDFQLSGEVSDETAQSIGKKLGAQTIISGAITAIGNAYRLRIRAISVETAQILGMQNIDVAQDSRLAALTGTAYAGPATVTRSNTSTPAAQPSANTQSASSIMLSSADWQAYSDTTSSAKVNIGREYIDGQERDVLTLEINLARGDSKWAGTGYWDDTIAQKLKGASGVRFKTLGDGKTWILIIPMTETNKDGNAHRANITTRNGRVVEIDIPFSRLRQPEWGKKVTFNKNSIVGMQIQRENAHGAGAATIKVFDIEIY
jgi:TolB-like protein